MVAIFISYRRSDSTDTVGRIYDRLSDSFGKESVFKDVDSIPLAVDFRVISHRNKVSLLRNRQKSVE